jgi:4-amino-4-deoxy-L-arabinose transferase-like glycosyltransferase
MSEAAPRIPAWAWVALTLVLVFDVWYRGHTIGPTVLKRCGVRLWPVVQGRSEPLDCDEAVYAYIGRRLASGAVMYRDLTENKPPAGYWLYALAVAIGGANELTIRLMPVPLVFATIALVWWIGVRLFGPSAGCVAAALYAILSTDPYLFGNGANFEHAINLFATASLAAMVLALGRDGRLPLLAAGCCLGTASLFKQVTVLHFVVYGYVLLWAPRPTSFRTKFSAVLVLGAGMVLVWGLAAAVLMGQGAGRDAYEDIFQYGRALAMETPADPHAPPFWARWVTGNADPSGSLPPPFGKTRYLVWWGGGSWPIWLAALLGLVRLLIGRGATVEHRLVAAWTLSACVQVALPGLFWPHYYLLPTPGLALAVASLLAPLTARSAAAVARPWARRAALVVLALAAIAATVAIQVGDYLGTPPEELTIRYKGGRQWVVLRDMGAELAKRARIWKHPRIFIWGWQSPLYIYGKLDGVSRQAFVDPLIKAYAGKDHPLIRPRVERMMRDLRERPPEIIQVGDPPFPALREFLFERYVRSRLAIQAPDGRGLWIKREDLARFESAGD